MLRPIPFLAALTFSAIEFSPRPARAAEIQLAQGALVGEVTPTTAILQTRLTASPRPVDGDVPGAAGVARFEIAHNETFENAQQTPWTFVTAEGDFIAKAKVDGLLPSTR